MTSNYFGVTAAVLEGRRLVTDDATAIALANACVPVKFAGVDQIGFLILFDFSACCPYLSILRDIC